MVGRRCCGVVARSSQLLLLKNWNPATSDTFVTGYYLGKDRSLTLVPGAYDHCYRDNIPWTGIQRLILSWNRGWIVIICHVACKIILVLTDENTLTLTWSAYTHLRVVTNNVKIFMRGLGNELIWMFGVWTTRTWVTCCSNIIHSTAHRKWIT